MTIVTPGGATGEPRGVPQARRASARLACLVTLTVIAGGAYSSSAPAQGDITDRDLADASGGRSVRVGSVETGHVMVLPLEMYVARVLAGESEPKSSDTARQVLAVAIRTFALANAGRHGRDGYDLCDTTHCQVPRQANAVTRRASLATAGQLLTFEGEPAALFYSASCGGQSESASEVWPGADYPYLRSAPDDVHGSDVWWELELSLRDVQRALEQAGLKGERLTGVEVNAYSASGRVSRLRVSGLQPDIITGQQFRMALGATLLRSTAFAISKSGATLRFTGRGFGHGVGMCVVGAGRRAARGETAEAILAHYYPGLALIRLDDARVAPPAANR